MLPPFRVRKLGRSTSTAARASHSSTLVPNDDPLLCITAPQYDSTISDHPDAKLRYVDDDDGEIVTVGTSLELSQRLQEPPSQRLHPQHGHHVFDVDRKEASVKVWQSLAEQGSQLGSVGGPVASECDHSMSSQDPPGPLGHNAARIPAPTAVAQDQEVDRSSIESEVEDYRKRYIEACNPPQVVPPHDAMPALFRRSDTAKHTSGAISKRGISPRTLSLVAGATSLTPEGQRQAQAAGDRMRASRYSRRTMAATEPLPLNYRNRWASYNRSTPCFGVDSRLNFVDPLAGDSSSSRRHAQAATDIMRSGNNLISLSKSKSDVCNPETIGTRNLVNSGGRCVHFDVPNDHANNRSRSSAVEKPMKNDQSESLLEVFESEFSKNKKQGEFVGVAPEQIHSSPNIDLSVVPMRTSNPAPGTRREERNFEGSRIETPLPNTPSGEQLFPSIQQSVDDIAGVISHLRTQPQASEVNLLTQQMALALEKALDCAFCELKICLRKVAESAKDVTKLAYNEPQYRSDQQTEDLLQTSQNSWYKATASARTCSHPQCLPAKGTFTKSRKMSKVPLRESPSEKAVNAPSSLDLSISRRDEPGRSQARFPKADSLKSDLKIFDSDLTSEATARPDLHEHKTTQGSHVSLPLNHELPVPKDHTAINLDFNLGMPSSGSFAPDHERPAKLTEQYQVASPASGSRETNGGHSQTFPSLPGMKPLLPSQTVQSSSGDLVAKVNSSTSPDITKSLRTMPSFPGAPVHNHPNPIANQGDAEQSFLMTDPVSYSGQRYENGSSGHGFRRMTCLDADEAESDPSVAPALHRESPRTLNGLQRSATVVDLNDKYTRSSRRPYSMNFDSSGRMPSCSFLQQGSARVEGSSAKNVHTWQDSLQLGAQNPNASASFSQDIYTAEHTDVTTASKVQECVEQLRKLGFGSDAHGSVQRLVIYAQAANGDLVEAIDMIDEEERAYRQRC